MADLRRLGGDEITMRYRSTVLKLLAVVEASAPPTPIDTLGVLARSAN